MAVNVKKWQIDPAVPELSQLGLGSWNTYQRMTFEDLVALLRRSLDRGVTLFDVAFYWDGLHVDVAFGRAIAETGVDRSQYAIAEKVWMWSYPEETLAAQVKRTLRRLGTDYIDIAMLARPLPGMSLPAFVDEVTALVKDGLVRSWSIENWEATRALEAWEYAVVKDLPRPGMLQLQYNVARRAVVESAEYDGLFSSTGIRLSPADVLEGGILAGRLDRFRVDPPDMERGVVPAGRNIARDAGGVRQRIRDSYDLLRRVAADFGATPVQAALAFVLANPHTGSALMGVTTIEQLEENLRAVELVERFGDELVDALAPLAVEGVRHPELFAP